MTKKPGTSTRAKKPRTTTPKDNAKNMNDDERRALFLSHRPQYIAALAKIKVAEKARDDIVTAAKGDGFTKKELDISVALSDLKGEKKVIADVQTRMRVARWIGHKLGNQGDLFAEKDPAATTDAAYDAGKMDSMEGRPCKPVYAPGTDNYNSYMAGFSDDQTRLQASVGRGDGKDPPITEPASGMRMSRKDFERQEALAKEKAAAPGDDDAALALPGSTAPGG